MKLNFTLIFVDIIFQKFLYGRQTTDKNTDVTRTTYGSTQSVKKYENQSSITCHKICDIIS